MLLGAVNAKPSRAQLFQTVAPGLTLLCASVVPTPVRGILVGHLDGYAANRMTSLLDPGK
jgi:hypothetical protein